MKPPSILLSVSEAPRYIAEVASLILTRPLLKHTTSGDGHCVMVIPGFLADDGSNRLLLEFLNSLGYKANGWGQGRNRGPDKVPLEELVARVDELARQSGESVTLIGHSLGGIFAREVARKRPENIRHVITLGSAFGEGRESGSRFNRLFDQLNPTRAIDPELEATKKTLAIAPPVPTTAIFTRGDGIVNWRTTVQQPDHEKVQNIRVVGSHSGLTVNPVVWRIIARLLPQSDENWQPDKSAVVRNT